MPQATQRLRDWLGRLPPGSAILAARPAARRPGTRLTRLRRCRRAGEDHRCHAFWPRGPSSRRC